MKSVVGRVTSILASRKFFYGVIIFFLLESAWIACSAVYPMAFDEDFHLGIITVYSHHWLPFLNAQPDGPAQFGALQHDPSYLYHYLMSFPYRLVNVFTDRLIVQVVLLRLINIVLFGLGIVLFRRVLRRAGMSSAFSNIALAIFVLIPIVPLLAGQINYDNLLLPVVAGVCLLVFDIHDSFAKRAVPIKALVLLLALCLFGSLVKYPFLPLAAGAWLFVCVDAWRAFRGRPKQVVRSAKSSLKKMGTRLGVGLLVALVVLLGLFLQRYGYNLVVYHAPVPECDRVLSELECTAYGPWFRNHELSFLKSNDTSSALSYTWEWLQSLHYRLFFVVNGPSDSFRNYPPLPLPSAVGIGIAVTSIAALLLYARRIFYDRPLLVFLLGITLLYCAVLWIDTHSQYVETGQPVAINGRYLVPVLVPLAAVLGSALRVALSKHTSLKVLFAVAALVLFLQGGGVFSFIARSDEHWYWRKPIVIHANNGARTVLSPVLIEGSKEY